MGPSCNAGSSADVHSVIDDLSRDYCSVVWYFTIAVTIEGLDALVKRTARQRPSRLQDVD